MTRPTWEQFARLASTPCSQTVRGTVTSAETGTGTAEHVSFAPPDQWRIEDGEHCLRYLANHVGHFQYPAGGGPVACFAPRRADYWHSGGMQSPSLIMPRDLMKPVDDDFTAPLGPIEEVSFLSRRAWRAVLAPPARKPHPVVQLLDVDSGVTLAYQSTDGQPILAFTGITIGEPLSADTFTASSG